MYKYYFIIFSLAFIRFSKIFALDLPTHQHQPWSKNDEGMYFFLSDVHPLDDDPLMPKLRPSDQQQLYDLFNEVFCVEKSGDGFVITLNIITLKSFFKSAEFQGRIKKSPDQLENEWLQILANKEERAFVEEEYFRICIT